MRGLHVMEWRYLVKIFHGMLVLLIYPILSCNIRMVVLYMLLTKNRFYQ